MKFPPQTKNQNQNKQEDNKTKTKQKQYHGVHFMLTNSVWVWGLPQSLPHKPSDTSLQENGFLFPSSFRCQETVSVPSLSVLAMSGLNLYKSYVLYLIVCGFLCYCVWKILFSWSHPSLWLLQTFLLLFRVDP